MIHISYTLAEREYDYIRVTRIGPAMKAYMRALVARGATCWKVRLT